MLGRHPSVGDARLSRHGSVPVAEARGWPAEVPGTARFPFPGARHRGPARREQGKSAAGTSTTLGTLRRNAQRNELGLLVEALADALQEIVVHRLGVSPEIHGVPDFVLGPELAKDRDRRLA